MNIRHKKMRERDSIIYFIVKTIYSYTMIRGHVKKISFFHRNITLLKTLLKFVVIIVTNFITGFLGEKNGKRIFVLIVY